MGTRKWKLTLIKSLCTALKGTRFILLFWDMKWPYEADWRCLKLKKISISILLIKVLFPVLLNNRVHSFYLLFVITLAA